MRFSQRNGLTAVATPLAADQMPDALRNRLWSVSAETLMSWCHVYTPGPRVAVLWDEFFRIPKDTMPGFQSDLLLRLRDVFFKFEWHQVFDFIESLVEITSRTSSATELVAKYNAVLSAELAAWCFAGTTLQRVTTTEEVAEIEAALAHPLSSVQLHVQTSLQALGRRPTPDSRGAIKESIHALEAIAKVITGRPNAVYTDLVQSLKAIGAQPQFVEAWKNLYNYSSAAGGIRHAAREDEPLPTAAEAKLFVITASSFINYLTSTFPDRVGAR
jgi:hypothetical protein